MWHALALACSGSQALRVPDGACLFTRGMGLTCTWSSERGFGERSWRYSAVVNDGTVEWIAVEGPRVENSGPDPFEVSSAEAMLSYLTTAPAAKKAK